MSDLADLTSHHIEGIAAVNGQHFKVTRYSQIDRNLWTGGCPPEAGAPEFKFIVCLYPWEPYRVHDDQCYTQAKLYDSGSVPDTEILKVLADHVNRCVQVGPTLVHCQAGLNRSNLVAALALIRGGMNAVDAVKLLRDKRGPAVLCNPAFEQWLLTQ
jgi:hypothetical protein